MSLNSLHSHRGQACQLAWSVTNMKQSARIRGRRLLSAGRFGWQPGALLAAVPSDQAEARCSCGEDTWPTPLVELAFDTQMACSYVTLCATPSTNRAGDDAVRAAAEQSLAAATASLSEKEEMTSRPRHREQE